MSPGVQILFENTWRGKRRIRKTNSERLFIEFFIENHDREFVNNIANSTRSSSELSRSIKNDSASVFDNSCE